jgi:hypothetical protein
MGSVISILLVSSTHLLPILAICSPLVILAAKCVIAIVSSTPSSFLKGEYRRAYVTCIGDNIYGLGPSVQPKK